jgi:hypothetical protein
MSRLVVNPDTPEAWPIELQPGSIALGRSEENDFALEHSSVSSRHCRITVSDAGVRIQDVGSTAGTFLDGELVEEANLKPGQLIRLGEVAMRFESDTPMGREPGLQTPPLARPIHDSQGPAASGVCKFHPRISARFVCSHCGQSYCDLCVTTRSVEGGARHFCRRCGAECQPVRAPVQPEAAEAPGFFAALPSAFLYPFQGSGVVLLVAGTAFFYLLGKLPLIGLLITGYLFNYAKSIITTTANGQRELPDWPDFTDWREDILVPYFHLFALVALAFGPALLVAVCQSWQGTEPGAACFCALAIGLLLAPMGMLGLAMFDSVSVLNPVALTWSIMRVPVPYLVAAVAFELVLLFHWFAEGAIDKAMPIPILPGLISGFLSLYLVSVGMRILGLLYRCHSDQFGWFNRSRV